MPLNDVGRRYAESLFQNSLEEAIQWRTDRASEITSTFRQRNILQSGGHMKALAELHVEFAQKLARARADSLLKAYERQGLPFNDIALSEITTEVNQFLHSHQVNAEVAIGQSIRQNFGGNVPPGMEGVLIQGIRVGMGSVISRLNRELRIKRDEVILDEMRSRKAYAAGLGKRWDVFICHASEDKAGFVRPLAAGLQASGLSVWYDELTLTVGDSLRRKIDEGIANSRYGIVVLSHPFFAKNWPQHELDGLMSREVAETGTKVILPVWHEIALEEVRQYSPILSGLVAASSNEGLDTVVRKLRDAMGLGGI